MVFEANTFSDRIEDDFVWRVWRGSGHLRYDSSTEAEVGRVAFESTLFPHTTTKLPNRGLRLQRRSKGTLLIRRRAKKSDVRYEEVSLNMMSYGEAHDVALGIRLPVCNVRTV